MEIKSSSNYYASPSQSSNVRFQGSVNAMSRDVISMLHDQKGILKLLYKIKTHTPQGVRNDIFINSEDTVTIVPMMGKKRVEKACYFNPFDDIKQIEDYILDYLRQFNMPGIPNKR
ncbi:MAG: hypothetical protein PHC34_13410 [Candidatus Gastranaerophilales bacterium]|nr:hypothetical protein [Candidatus Gastranaerophilales bacterium]